MLIGIATSSDIIRAGLETILAKQHAIRLLPHDVDRLAAELPGEVEVLITTEAGTARRLAKRLPVMLLSTGESEPSLSALIKSGVRAILPLGGSASMLVQALNLMETGVQLIPKIDEVVRAFQETTLRVLNVNIRGRELPVVQLVAEGLSDAEISDRLGLTKGTVSNYVYFAMRQLGLKSRTQLALWYRDLGLPKSI